MNAPLERLKSAGYKLTKARQVVLTAIEQAGGHITSGDVLERVGELDQNIGRASVFRTLDLFTRLSIIRPTYIGTSMTPYYVLMPDGHHHHIICIICNRVIEFAECGLDAMASELEKRLNVKLTGHLLEFYGRCDQCINKPLVDEEN